MAQDFRNMGDPEKLSEDEVQKDLEQQERDQKMVNEKYDEWGKLVIFPDLQAAEKRVLSCEQLDGLARRMFSWMAWMIKGVAERNEDTENAADNLLGQSILNTYNKAAADCNVDCMYRSVGMAVKGLGGTVAEKLAVEFDDVQAAVGKCVHGLTGTVTVVTEKGGTASMNGLTASGSTSFNMTCKLDGTGGPATCHETYSATASGNGVTEKQSSSDYIGVPITAAAVDGKTEVHIGLFNINETITAEMVGGTVKTTGPMQWVGWDAEGTSGTWTDGAGTTITWSLSNVN
jgi:hypothetical protein